MGVESAADRLAFLDTDAFGIEVSYSPVSGGTSTIKAIFDAASQSLEVGIGVALSSVAPQVMVRTADLSNGGRQGDTFVIEGTTYKAVEIQPDGTGFTAVKLEMQS